MGKIVIGIDFGSDSVRAIAVDTTTGRSLARVCREYSRWKDGCYCDPAESRFRQHPSDHLESLRAVVPELIEEIDRDAVVGLGIDTTACTMAPADRSGIPLALLPEFAEDPDAMFVLWKDHTAAAEARRITEIARQSSCDYTQFCGRSYSAECFFSKALHLLETNERIRRSAFTFVDQADWLTGLLTGCTDPLKMRWNVGSAGHKALWNRRWGGLPPEEFFQQVSPLLAGIRERVYPSDRVTPTETPAGRITPDWAEALGLPEGVILSTGMMDGLSGATGCGVKPGKAARLLGTSASDLIVAPALASPIPGVSSQMDDSLWTGMTTVELGQSAFGDIYAWFRRFMSYGGEISWERLNSDAALVPPGACGTIAVDWFNGRRSPHGSQTVQGAIAGLSLGSTPPMIFRSLIEATAFGSRRNFDHVEKHGIEVREIVAAGGITKKSSLIMQVCADIIKKPIGLVEAEEISALGAAVYASVACGVFPDMASASDALAGRCGRVFSPDSANSAIYERIYEKYLALGNMIDSPEFLRET